MEIFIILIGMFFLIMVCIPLSTSKILSDESESEKNYQKNKNKSDEYLKNLKHIDDLEYSEIMEEKIKIVVEEEKLREEINNKVKDIQLYKEEVVEKEVMFDLIEEDSSVGESISTTFDFADYYKLINMKMDITHNVFIDKFKELNIDGKLYGEKDSIKGILENFKVVVSGISIHIIKVDKNKYLVQYLKKYSFPNSDDNKINIRIKNVFDDIKKSHLFDSFILNPLDCQIDKFLDGKSSEYMVEFNAEYIMNSESRWRFSQKIFKAWGDLNKFAIIFEDTL